MKKFTTEEITDLYGQVTMGKISFSRMAKVINQRMNETSEPQYKDGDFVVNVCGVVIIFKNKDGSYIYDHAYFSELAGVISFSNFPTLSPIERYATEEEKQELLDALAKKGKRWNAEKLCIEDIPQRKFKPGDKVKLKNRMRNKREESPYFVTGMEVFIGKVLTVGNYKSNGHIYMNEAKDFEFAEAWLEPCSDDPIVGELAIFWDSDKRSAFIGEYNSVHENSCYPHRDNRGNTWMNAIKFDSKEQYERLIKGEL